MPSIGGLFAGAGGVAEQLVIWAVLQQLIGAAFQPVLQSVSAAVMTIDPSTPLSPADAALLVLKGWYNFDEGAAEAAKVGINRDRFQQLVNATGEPPAIEQLLFLWRRGDIDEARVEHGIRESRVRDEWIDAVKALRRVPLSPSDAVAAVIRAQISMDQGKAIAWLSGIEADDFQTLYNTTGNPPSPTQLNELMNRGLIPRAGTGPDVLSVQQGIAEGDTKNKWWEMVAQLARYVPPPRTVTALLRAGSITSAQAIDLFQQSGLTGELAQAYVDNAHTTKTTTQRQLAESQVLDMYETRVINETQAHDLLAALRYDDPEIAYLLALRDVQAELRVVNAAVSKIGNLFVARKIGADTAHNALTALELDPKHVATLMQTWALERDATVKLLTAAEITGALFYQVIDQPTAIASLMDLGYTEYDAWVLLSVRAHAPLPDRPAIGKTITGQLP